jgi:hypothetical protein
VRSSRAEPDFLVDTDGASVAFVDLETQPWNLSLNVRFARAYAAKLLAGLPRTTAIVAEQKLPTAHAVKRAQALVRHLDRAQLDRRLGALAAALGVPVSKVRADLLALRASRLDKVSLGISPHLEAALAFDRGALLHFSEVPDVVVASRLH